MPDSPASHPIPASFNLRALINDPQRGEGHQGLGGDPQIADSGREESDGASRGEEPAAKKRRLATGDFTRRKRAATACQFCRLRKTKCDNVRPSCGYCVRHKAKCVYGDAEWLEKGDEQDDSIGEQILKQLKDIKDMLHWNQPPLPSISPLNNVVPSPRVAVSSTIATSPEVQTGPSPWAGTTDGGHTVSNAESPNPISRPHALARCESLLKWPVFDGIVPKEHTQVDSFLMDSDYRARHQNREAQTSTQEQARGITDDAFVPLCRKFLAHVHPRNPVLNGDELMRFARTAEEHGVKWDSQSCLVVSTIPILE
jgi:hypothetical protein